MLNQGIYLVGGRLEDALHELNETFAVLLRWNAGDSCITIPQRLQSVFKLLLGSIIGQSINNANKVNDFSICRQYPTIVTLIERNRRPQNLLGII